MFLAYTLKPLTKMWVYVQCIVQLLQLEKSYLFPFELVNCEIGMPTVSTIFLRIKQAPDVHVAQWFHLYAFRCEGASHS